VTTSLEELRRSDWHQELGRKMCAAYISQQQGIAVGTALKNVSTGPIGDLWLQIAEFARSGCLDSSSDLKNTVFRAGTRFIT
jgi:hypothetical protein